MQLANVPYGHTPPGEWLDGPQPGFGPGSPVTVDLSNGRFTAWSHLWDTAHVSQPKAWKDQGFRPLPSPSGNSWFHRGTITTNEGDQVSVGVIPLAGGHSKAVTNVAQATADYDDVTKQRVVGRAVENELGTMICGSILPGTTVDEVHQMLRSSLSGDWRRRPDYGNQMDYLNPCFVSVPGLPVGAAPDTLDDKLARILNQWSTELNSQGEIVMATGTNIMTDTKELTPPEYDALISKLETERDAAVQAMAGEDHEPRISSLEEEVQRLGEAFNRLAAKVEDPDEVAKNLPDAETDE